MVSNKAPQTYIEGSFSIKSMVQRYSVHRIDRAPEVAGLRDLSCCLKKSEKSNDSEETYTADLFELVPTSISHPHSREILFHSRNAMDRAIVIDDDDVVVIEDDDRDELVLLERGRLPRPYFPYKILPFCVGNICMLIHSNRPSYIFNASCQDN